MFSKTGARLVFAIVLVALFFAGCLGSGQQPSSTSITTSTPTPTAAEAQTQTATPTPIVYPGGSIEEAIEKALA
ncbi:MAG TPA: hypothetical protein VI875_00805 [Candidatus Norongarragalinales archaeon]|nr:hypothetical protein [Candidatus Norongarragalinales archaeon]